MDISTETLAYLAGALDADGYFTIKRNTYAMRVRGDAKAPVFSERIGLKQVCPIVPDLLKECFGGSRGTQKPSARQGQPLHYWQVTDRQAVAVVNAVLPYLRIKRQQAEILLALRMIKDAGRTGVRESLHKDRWGRERLFRHPVLSAEDISARATLFEQVKGLNDSRPLQPALG